MAKDKADVKPLYVWRDAVRAAELTATEKWVAVALSFYMNEDGRSAFPGAARLARDCGLTPRTVRVTLAALVAGGWVRQVERGGLKGQSRRANAYELVPNGGSTFTREPVTPVNLTHTTRETDAPNQGTSFTPVFQETSLIPQRKLSRSEVEAIVTESRKKARLSIARSEAS